MTETAKDIEATVRSFFATPVAMVRLPEPGDLNAALRETVLARERETASLQHSNLGGWQSSWDFAEWGGDAGRAVLGAVTRLANTLTSDRHGKSVSVSWKSNSWANVNRAGHGNEFHTHPGAYWSATYYVDDGGIADNPALGGEFEIQDPRGVAPAMYAPLLAFAVPGGQSVGASELIRPVTGMLMMFPSWLSHGVRPYTGSGMRISIAMNLTI